VPAMDQNQFGEYLKSVRRALGLTLRQVEQQTGGRVKNGYLSQIENGAITLVSPGILWELGEVYDVPYRELLDRAGHRVPEDKSPKLQQAIAGIPLRAIAELDEEAQQDLIEYIAFLKQRKT
jgi:HTH-type transcriptional regulator, competence development regulator